MDNTPIEKLIQFIEENKRKDINNSQYWKGFNMALSLIKNRANSLIPDETEYYIEKLNNTHI